MAPGHYDSNMNITRMAAALLLLAAGLASLPAQDGQDDHDDHEEIEGLYLHEHNGIPHDLSLARIDFEGDAVTDPQVQLYGRWELKDFMTTDAEMMELVQMGAFKIWMEVTEDHMQVKLQLMTNGKMYSDPPHAYDIHGREIDLENPELDAALKDGDLIFTMVAADEAFRYTFARDNPPGSI